MFRANDFCCARRYETLDSSAVDQEERMTPRQMREAAGLTQEELAKAAHLSVPTVRSMEAGDTSVNLRSVSKAAKVLRVSLVDMVQAIQAAEPAKRRRARKAIAS